MKQNKISGPRKFVYGIGVVVFAILLVLAIKFPLTDSPRASHAASAEGPTFAAGSAERFALLSGRSGQRSVGST